MDFTLDQPLRQNLKVAMNRLGYHQFRDPNTGKVSYVCRLGGGFYPRFHLYVDDRQSPPRFSLHLDQKQPSYRGSHAHSGQYDGPEVEAEAQRIYSYLIRL